MRLKKYLIIVTAFALTAGVLSGVYILFQNYTKRQITQKFYYGKNLIKEEKWNKAADIFEQIFKKYPKSKTSAAAKFYYALSLEKLGKQDEAYKDLNEITEDFPETIWAPLSFLVMAKAKLAKGEMEESKFFYEKVINKYSNFSSIDEAWLGLGEICEQKGKLAEAKSFYEKVVKEYPQGDVYSIAQQHLGNLQIKMIFSSSPSTDSFIYKVSQGDTLVSIAKRFKTTVDLIKKANKLKSSYLSVGKRLKITSCYFNILVDKTQNILVLKNSNDIIKIYSVATGKFNSTPIGNFTITTKLKNPDWYFNGRRIPSGHPDNILGSRWMGLSEPSYGIHGTTLPESIGTQSTEGCVRMLNSDVDELYKLVIKGTSVEIIN